MLYFLVRRRRVFWAGEIGFRLLDLGVAPAQYLLGVFFGSVGGCRSFSFFIHGFSAMPWLIPAVQGGVTGLSCGNGVEGDSRVGAGRPVSYRGSRVGSRL